MDKKIGKKETPAMRQKAQKEAILARLRQLPVIEPAVQKAGVSRATFYRMRDADDKFKADAETAITEGVVFISDISEAQLVQMIREKNFQAIKLWLQVHNPKYSRKLEIAGKVELVNEELTEEEVKILKESLRKALPEGEADTHKDEQ